jgi:biotin carboxylase
MGHRRGITKALEQRGISFCIWSEREVKGKTKSTKTLINRFPEDYKSFKDHFESEKAFTHIIAGVEAAVIPASLVRSWLDLERNPHGHILKCTDKLIMKTFLSKQNIPMTPFVFINSLSEESNLKAKLGESFVCKPRQNSGGRGIVFCSDLSVVTDADLKDVYFERKILGKEGSVESFIKDSEITFTNITEYKKSGFSNLVPASYSKEIQQKILDLNEKVIKALNIKWGMTHLEFYLTKNDILFGEVALRPPGGYIMEALTLSYGINFWDQYVDIELHQKADIDIKLQSYSSSIILHPGEGTVKSIEGIGELEQLESLKKFKLKAQVGDIVSKRDGVGEDLGYILLSNTAQDKLINDINSLESSFRILV